jgi:hypothetical protein
MVDIIQPSFSAGEVSPKVQARVDLSKRAVAVEKALNGLVSVTGSIDKRPGTEYVDETYGGKPGRLIAFEYNREQTYVLEFTDYYLRIFRDASLKDSLATPYPIDDVYEFDVAQYGDQMTIVHPNRRPRELLRVADDDWTLEPIDFLPQQASPTNITVRENKKETAHEVSGVTQANPGVVTTSSAHDLADNDTVIFEAQLSMTELERGLFKVGVLTSTTFKLLDPEDGSDYDTSGYTAWSGTDDLYEAPRIRTYAVTAVNGQTGEESIVGTGNVSDDVDDINSATPAKVRTVGGHGLLTGDEVTFSGTGTILDGNRFTVTREENRRFTISWQNGEDVDGALVAWSSGGRFTRCFAAAERSKDDKWDNDVFWDKVDGAVIYNVYASDGGAYGLIGSTTRTKFRDYYIAPDTSIAPPVAYDPFFDPAGNKSRYPSCVAYHDQRRIFANSDEFPNRLWMSQPGNFYNLAWSTPTKDDDAIVVSIASSQISDVSFLLSLQELIALTEGGEFMVTGDGALTPSTLSIKGQGFYGAGGLPPLVAGNVGLLHLNGNVIRDFEYAITSQTFVGKDLTILGRHLLDDETLRGWAYAHAPSACIVILTRNGKWSPVFTYFPEQEVFGWSRWQTQDGYMTSICTVKENGFDRIYAIVHRGSGATASYYLERFALPSDDPYEYHGVDFGLRYDTGAATAQLINVDEETGHVTVTCLNGHGLSNGNTCDISDAYEVGEDGVPVLSDNYNGDGFIAETVSALVFKLKDSNGDYVDGSGWAPYSSRAQVRKAVATVSGLDHLEGKTVVAAANGREYIDLLVSEGEVTLPEKASRISVGYPFTFEVVTLPVSSYEQGGAIEGLMKNVNRFALHVVSSAEFYAGPERDAMELYEVPYTEPKLNARQTVIDKSQLVTIPGSWSRNRSVMLQQRSPLFMSIASIIPDALLGDV